MKYYEVTIPTLRPNEYRVLFTGESLEEAWKVFLENKTTHGICLHFIDEDKYK